MGFIEDIEAQESINIVRNDFVIHRVKIAPSIPFKPVNRLGAQASNAGCVYMISRARVELHWTGEK